MFRRVLGRLLQPLVAGGELGPRLCDGLHCGPSQGGGGGGAEMDQSAYIPTDQSEATIVVRILPLT